MGALSGKDVSNLNCTLPEQAHTAALPVSVLSRRIVLLLEKLRDHLLALSGGELGALNYSTTSQSCVYQGVVIRRVLDGYVRAERLRGAAGATRENEKMHLRNLVLE